MKENIKISQGDICFLNGDISAATYYYITKKDLIGLQKVAGALFEKGRDDEANEILKKSFEISKLLDK